VQQVFGSVGRDLDGAEGVTIELADCTLLYMIYMGFIYVVRWCDCAKKQPITFVQSYFKKGHIAACRWCSNIN
jgi:hypothetical protein